MNFANLLQVLLPGLLASIYLSNFSLCGVFLFDGNFLLASEITNIVLYFAPGVDGIHQILGLIVFVEDLIIASDLRHLQFWVLEGRIAFLGLDYFHEGDVLGYVGDILVLQSDHLSILGTDYLNQSFALGHDLGQALLAEGVPTPDEQSGRVFVMVLIFAKGTVEFVIHGSRLIICL